MARWLASGLVLASLIFTPVVSIAQASADASLVESINRDCRLKDGTLALVGNEVRLQPPPDEDFESLECALDRLKKSTGLKFGFVGNELDPDTVLSRPLRYIAEGTRSQISALSNAALAEKWTVIMRALGSHGLTLLQFESGLGMTNAQSERLLNRIWKKEFGDIAFGQAPQKLSAPDYVSD
ncbi:MAG: hypothetical protein EON56_05340 [Alphaproteobacteria bacterium]|nr:MAG: hypothetical protein EON56_05340 [Alphaproteobacteria bacterium]